MTAIDDLAALGTSTWLDDLSRERITTGNLQQIIDTKSVVGVTTNPAIFAAAMTKTTAYDQQIATLAAVGASPEEAVYSMAIDDVRKACDIFRPIYESSGGHDGRVSIEVDPRISDDAQATVNQARQLWRAVGRENLMIKIPATPGSLPAITEALSEGISVNVTLIFSVDCYKSVVKAWKDGIRSAAEHGRDVSKIYSVASLFVSRLDAEVDARLEKITGVDKALFGTAGLANSRAAYQVFVDEVAGDSTLPEGTNVQRLLWASTGVKNPNYPADMYVVGLAGPDTVNTMPESTIDAAMKGGRVKADTLSGTAAAAAKDLKALADAGIDFDDVFAVLEREGVEKFVACWNDLLASIGSRLGA